MKVFVVNLDAAQDRMAFMKEQLEGLGIAYERFPAIYGKALPPETLKKYHAPFRQWLKNGITLSLSEIGCALSHLTIFQKMVDENLPMACIVEDDSKLLPTLPMWLKKLDAEIDPTVSAAYILHQGPDEVSVDQPFEIQEIEGTTHCSVYVVTLPFAKQLIKYNAPILFPIDNWRRWRIFGKLYLCTPRAGGHWMRKTFGSMMDDEQAHTAGVRSLKGRLLYKFWALSFRLVERGSFELRLRLQRLFKA